MLEITNLHVGREEKEILHGINFSLPKGEVHVIMGPNGSGKSTLAHVLMGHPNYTVTNGSILIDGEDITGLAPNERSARGLFLSMQHTPEIPGVTVANFLRTALTAKTGESYHPVKFYKSLQERLKTLGMDPDFAKRALNVGFSGGEKKRLEILQLLTLDPTYAILDETDSGLDVDAMKMVGESINQLHDADHGILIITHYTRFLKYITPDKVHILRKGVIVKTGGQELAKEIEEQGFSDHQDV